MLDPYLAVPDTGPLASSLLAEISSYRFVGLRVDVSEDHVRARSQALAFTTPQALLAFPTIKLIFLLAGGSMTRSDDAPWTSKGLEDHTRDECRKLLEFGYFDPGRVYHPAFEIGNEPDLAHDYWKGRPKDLAKTFSTCYAIIREFSSSSPVLSPSISNLNERGLKYLEKMAPYLPPGCCVAFHRYPASQFFSTPHKGSMTRNAEIETLREFAGDRPLWNTETGWAEINKGYQLTEAEISERLTQEIEFHAALDVRVLTLYQINSAEILPEDSENVRRLKTYGLRAPTDHGWKWKPRAAVIRDTIERLGLG